MRKIISLVLAGALLLSACLGLSACGEGTTVAATVDGQQINAGIYIYYLNLAYNELYGNLTSDTEVASDFDVYAQTYEEKSASDWIIDRAMEHCAEYIAVRKEAERLGVSVPSEQKSYIDSLWEGYGYADVFGKMGISQASFRECLCSTYLSNEIFLKMYGTDGEKAVSEDELFKFLTDNYARVKYYNFSKSVSDSDSDVEGKLEALKSTANDLVSLMNNGGDFDNVISEYEKLQEMISSDSDSDGADSNTDSDTETDTDPYERESLIYKESYSPSEDFVKMVFEKTADDYNKPFFFEDSSNFYVVEILDVKERKDYLEDNHDSVLSNYKHEEYNEYISELAKSLTTDRNNSAVKRYEPKKLGVPAA